MNKIYINGKFLNQRMTGVQRFAVNIIKALDQILQESPCASDFEILLPPNAKPVDQLKVIRQRHVGYCKKSLTIWEQLELPIHTSDGTLLCLTGSAPFFVRSCIPTIHDAAVYIHPNAYSRMFVAWYKILFKRRASHSPVVLTVSKSSSDDLTKFLPSTNFRIIYNSAEHINCVNSDTNIINHLKLKPRGFLLAVGSLNKNKNFTSLIHAYSNSTLPDHIPLVIVGGVNKEIFRNESLAPDNTSVIWAGSVTDSQLRALYEKAALFIFPSIYEGFGIPPLEAMYCGCPVLASNASSIPEVCGNAAAYFDAKNTESITFSILSVLENDMYRETLISRGYKQARSYSWVKSANSIRDALIEFKYIDQ